MERVLRESEIAIDELPERVVEAVRSRFGADADLARVYAEPEGSRPAAWQRCLEASERFGVLNRRASTGWRRINVEGFLVWYAYRLVGDHDEAVELALETAIEEEAQHLVDEGFMQTSSRHGLLGRVPPGVAPLDALRRASPESFTRIERAAAREYARLYARDDDVETVSQEVLKAFRRLGGDVA